MGLTALPGRARVKGIELAYQISGVGAPLILLHGGFGSVEMFGSNVAALAASRKVIGVDLVATHQLGLERLRTSHGAPRPIRVMADMLALDADYRTRFGSSRLRPITMRNVVPALIAAVVAALSLALVVVSP